MEDWLGNTAVYTSVFGGYDYHGSQVMVDGVDYFYITDGISDPPVEMGWNTVYAKYNNPLDNRRKAKVPKLNPHSIDFLNKYKYTIWIDGDMQIISEDFVPEILSYLKNGMVISPHFDGRKCAYGEAEIRPLKYINEPLDEQVNFYKSEGFPIDYGLFECGVMARDMRNLAVREVGEIWLDQNFKWSYQDQVSLPYVLWKTKFKPDVLPVSFRYMDWIHINAHTREN